MVATVGCVDVAPAWLDQLAPHGFCLVPLQQAGWHPLTRIEPASGGATGMVVGRAGFVAIQGHQAGYSPWPAAGPIRSAAKVDWSDLPVWLAADLRPEPGRAGLGAFRLWDLAYLLALEDRRAAFMVSLSEGSSSAAVDSAAGRIGRAGPGGTLLSDRLLEIAERWADLGRPSLNDYISHFVAHHAESTDHRPVPAEWVVDRVDFRQTVTLTTRA